MATATLLNYEIEEGKRFLDALNEAGLSIDSSLWIYESERELWQLMLTSPLCNTGGTLKAYEAILKVFRQVEPALKIDWTSLVAVGPKHELIEGLRQLQCQFNLDFSGRRIVNNMVDRMLIEDAYVYQIK